MDVVNSDLAALSANSYRVGRNPANIAALPPGATELGYFSDPTTGFEAAVYDYAGKTVIAYTGTLPDSTADIGADVELGLGVPESQIEQAAEFYEAAKQTYGGDIIFTGHSLGGGLAALMGVFFNKQAVTFDQAPFRLSATQATAATIASYIAARGYGTDPDLAGFTTTESTLATSVSGLTGILLGLGIIDPLAALALASKAYPTTIRGEPNITSISTKGEFLTAGVGPLTPSIMGQLRIRNAAPDPIDNGGVGVLTGTEDRRAHV